MIEITSRDAVGLNAAVKVLTAMRIEPGDPLEWIRGIEVVWDKKWAGRIDAIRYAFWILGDPLECIQLDVQFAPDNPFAKILTRMPSMILVKFPHSDRVDRWDFDSEGKTPTKVS